ncbi:BnaC01g19350D [Brassica napus]|uniref:BnaC01g19350D protein n=1 Tax=Brassica napus TaxID=3708 RepID=A0A078GXD0_BRANA|nr:BnaC01g19350D [Brassica napus]
MLRGYQNSSYENFYGAKGRVNEQMVLDIKEAEREDDSLLCPSRDASPKGKLLLYFSNAKQRNLWMWKLLKPQWNIESFITTLEAPAHSLVTCKYSICFLFQIETLCLFLIIV